MNSKKYSGLLLALGLCFFGHSVFASELKIGYVDGAAVIERMPQAKDARSRIEEEFTAQKKIFVAEQKEVRRLEEKLITESDVMSKGQRDKIKRKVIRKKRALRRSQEDSNEDINIRQNEELGKLHKLLSKAIEHVAKKEGYDLILGEGALYASEKADVTGKILSYLKDSHSK